MQFVVPQFIEKEAKIAGPLTFKQFIVLGTAGAVCIFVFFVFPLWLFIIIAIVLLGGAVSLSFIKINKVSLPIFIKNFFAFLFKPRVYLWKKKSSPPRFLKKEERKTEREELRKLEEGKQSKLKVSRGSKLDELLTRIETK